MLSICFQPDQGLNHRHQNKKEMNIHSSHARPKTKTSDQSVGIADYMGTSLEVNGQSYNAHVHKIYVQQMHMCHN